MPRIRLVVGRRCRYRYRHRLRPVYTEQGIGEFPGGLVARDSHDMIGSIAGPAIISTSVSKNAGAHMVFLSHSMSGALADNARNSGMLSLSNSGSTSSGARKNPGMPLKPNTATSGGLVAWDSQAVIGSTARPAIISPSMSKNAGAHMDFLSHSMSDTSADNARNSGMLSMSISGSSGFGSVCGPFLRTMFPTSSGAGKNPGMPLMPNTGVLVAQDTHAMIGSIAGPAIISQSMSKNAGAHLFFLSHSMSGTFADKARNSGMLSMSNSGSTSSGARKNPGMPLKPNTATSVGLVPRDSHAVIGSTAGPAIISPSMSKNTGAHMDFLSHSMSDTLAGNARNSGMLSMSISGSSGSRSICGPFLGIMFPTSSGARKNPGMPLMQNAGGLVARDTHAMIGSIARPAIISPSMSKNAGAHMNFHSHSMYGTLADNARNSGMLSNSGSYEQLPHKVEIGDNTSFVERKSAEMNRIKDNISGFKDRYLKIVRPILASRCLIAPDGLSNPSTVFLHRQTNKILKHDPRYLSVFDIMSYEDGVDSLEWTLFLEYLTKRRVYIIEDENIDIEDKDIDIEDEAIEDKKKDKDIDTEDEAIEDKKKKKDLKLTMSSIETLLYDHGIKGPNDGTDAEFYKGECDGSFAKDKKASLSYIIWKDDTIIFSEIYQNIECGSATEAEVFAAFALLSKAKELGIQKLLICSDCLAVSRILGGQLIMGKSYPHLHTYLMLRSMRRHFKKLVATWKPRELMAFVDDVGKVGSDDFRSLLFKNLKQRWSSHLKGLPVFRIEWTDDTQKAIRKTFARTHVDESFGTNSSSVYFVGVEEEGKLDCLIGIKQSLQPSNLVLYLHDREEKSPEFIADLKKLAGNHIEKKSESYTCLASEHNPNDDVRTVVVVFDAVIPKEYYYNDDAAIHVLFATGKEMEIIKENNIPKLTALAFIYFNGVQFPLNDPFRKKNGDETKGKVEQKMEGWKDSDKRAVYGEEE